MTSFKSDTNIARFGANLRSTLRPLNLSAAIKGKEFNPIFNNSGDERQRECGKCSLPRPVT